MAPFKRKHLTAPTGFKASVHSLTESNQNWVCSARFTRQFLYLAFDLTVVPGNHERFQTHFFEGLSHALNTSSTELKPAELMALLNDHLVQDEPLGIATVACLLLDANSDQLLFALGGHPNPILQSGDLDANFFLGEDKQGLPLGIAPSVEFPECAVQLRQHDRLLVPSFDYFDDATAGYLDGRLTYKHSHARSDALLTKLFEATDEQESDACVLSFQRDS